MALRGVAWLLCAAGEEAGGDGVVSRSAAFSDLYSDDGSSAMWRLPPDASAVEDGVRAACGPYESASNKLRFMEAYARLEEVDVDEDASLDKTGLSLQLRCRADGAVFVCQATVFGVEGLGGKVMRCHVHEDVTSAVSVGSLLSAAGTGKYFELVRARRAAPGGAKLAAEVRRSISAIQDHASARDSHDFLDLTGGSCSGTDVAGLSADAGLSPDFLHQMRRMPTIPEGSWSPCGRSGA